MWSFWIALSFLYTSLIYSQTLPPNACTQPRIRKEWRELTEMERQSFIRANQCLKHRPSKLSPLIKSKSVWDDLVYVHLTANNDAHKGAPLLPWHRHFLIIYENLLRSECGFQGVLPFWDFAMDSQAPERSPIFAYFGGDGRASDHCLVNGPFANWTTQFPSVHCLSRRFQMNDAANGHLMGAQYTPIQIEYILNNYRNYHDFRTVLEEHPHNMIHYGIGGDMFDPTTSTNDPIFWVHHANVDRMWYTWQQRYPHLAYTYGGNRKPNSTIMDASPEDTLVFYGLGSDVKVKDTFYTLNNHYCYVYSHSILPIKMPTVPRANATATTRRPTGTFVPRPAGTVVPLPRTAPMVPVPVARPAGPTGPAGPAGSQMPPSAPMPANMMHRSQKRNFITPGPFDRQDPNQIRYNAPFSDAFLSKRYSPIEIKKIRQREAEMADFVDQVNQMGWKSNAALRYSGSNYRPASKEEYDARHSLMSTIVRLG